MTFVLALAALSVVFLSIALVVEEAQRRLTRPVPFDDTSRGTGRHVW